MVGRWNFLLKGFLSGGNSSSLRVVVQSTIFRDISAEAIPLAPWSCLLFGMPQTWGMSATGHYTITRDLSGGLFALGGVSWCLPKHLGTTPTKTRRRRTTTTTTHNRCVFNIWTFVVLSCHVYKQSFAFIWFVAFPIHSLMHRTGMPWASHRTTGPLTEYPE